MKWMHLMRISFLIHYNREITRFCSSSCQNWSKRVDTACWWSGKLILLMLLTLLCFDLLIINLPKFHCFNISRLVKRLLPFTYQVVTKTLSHLPLSHHQNLFLIQVQGSVAVMTGQVFSRLRGEIMEMELLG